MNVIDELIANNEGFAASLPDKHLDLQPSRRSPSAASAPAR